MSRVSNLLAAVLMATTASLNAAEITTSNLGDGDKLIESGVGNALVGRYLTRLELPAEAIIFATSASPNSILWTLRERRAQTGIQFEVLGAPKSSVRSSSSARKPSQHYEGVTGPWAVSIFELGCWMARKYADGSQLALSLSDDKTQLYLLLHNQRWAFKSGQIYHVEIALDGRVQKALGTGIANKTLGNGLLFAGPASTFFGQPLMPGSLSLYRDMKLIGTYRLDGGKAAFSQMLRCASERSG